MGRIDVSALDQTTAVAWSAAPERQLRSVDQPTQTGHPFATEWRNLVVSPSIFNVGTLRRPGNRVPLRRFPEQLPPITTTRGGSRSSERRPISPGAPTAHSR